ncbi:hypothetical protein Poli38472_010140 [Pythium oligandrum]|uniref:Uncharacterized protein n=1 Tax=Pythium oligandrum TaxID=41045 RepID=A0A8K1C8E8_PYTOL|nr:hypothetical protein Poli38472_010140 [Pythium oligandrum]|eukprot:TMW58581.1 hypothetical protein Poli38472_010140 [Pythium oligandrum]
MMAVIIGMPTVLIDTQVRIVIQRMQTLTFSIVGTIGMAVAELAFRLVKVALLKLQIHRREQRAPITPTLVNSMEHQTRTADDWKHRVQTYHVAEVYADMLAEYIAAGSALAIVGFYWNHPKYLLHRAANTENTDLDLQYGTNARQLVVFATQIGIQIVVDYVSCIVTIRNGIGFGAITRYATFISAVFITMASFNMQISALMYLDPDG